jgi:hypothetical protein
MSELAAILVGALFVGILSCRGRCDDAPVAGSNVPARMSKRGIDLLVTDAKGRQKSLALEIIGTRDTPRN